MFINFDFLHFRQEGCPRIHLGSIASGRKVAREDMLRQMFSAKYGALAYDCEFDAVIESVQGNCRDSFAVSVKSSVKLPKNCLEQP